MATINQIARDHKKERANINVRKQRLVPPSAERAAAKAAQHPEFKRRSITPAQKEVAEKEIAQRVEDMVKVAKKRRGRNPSSEGSVGFATISRDKKRIEEAKQAVSSAKAEATARVQTIRDRFSFESPVRVDYGKVGTGDIYAVEDLDTTVWVTINTESPFYKMLYEGNTQKPEMKSLLISCCFQSLMPNIYTGTRTSSNNSGIMLVVVYQAMLTPCKSNGVE